MSDIPFMQRFRVTEEEAYDAFNLVEDELWKIGVLWRSSKLDKVKLRYDKTGSAPRKTGSGKSGKPFGKTVANWRPKDIGRNGPARLSFHGAGSGGSVDRQPSMTSSATSSGTRWRTSIREL